MASRPGTVTRTRRSGGNASTTRSSKPSTRKANQGSFFELETNPCLLHNINMYEEEERQTAMLARGSIRAAKVKELKKAVGAVQSQ